MKKYVFMKHISDIFFLFVFIKKSLIIQKSCTILILELLKIRKIENQIKCFEIKTKFFEIKNQMLRKNNKLTLIKECIAFLLIRSLLMTIRSVHDSHVTSCDLTWRSCQMTKCTPSREFLSHNPRLLRLQVVRATDKAFEKGGRVTTQAAARFQSGIPGRHALCSSPIKRIGSMSWSKWNLRKSDQGTEFILRKWSIWVVKPSTTTGLSLSVIIGRNPSTRHRRLVRTPLGSFHGVNLFYSPPGQHISFFPLCREPVLRATESVLLFTIYGSLAHEPWWFGTDRSWVMARPEIR